MSRRVGVLAFLLYAAGIAAVTLGPSPGEVLFRAVRQVDGLDRLSFAAVEAIANVVLFIPLSLLLCAMLPQVRRWAVWVLCVVASISVELVQTLLPERSATTRDVLTNSAGAAVGVILHAAIFSRRRGVDRAGRSTT
jgi:glycopeptide antibiotics resistance protein